MNAKTVFEIVRLIDLHPIGQSGFCVLVRSPDDAFLNELRSELQMQTGRRLRVIDVRGVSPSILIEQLQAADTEVVVVSGLETWNDEHLIALDVNRSRLETDRFLILAVDAATAARLLDRAPNLRSYLATRVFVHVPDPSLMTERRSKPAFVN